MRNAGTASFESLLSRWDGDEVVVRFDSTSSSWTVSALHSTTLGPAVEGTRMKGYESFIEAVDDALHLAAGMTLKFAVAGFPRGGGKAVIAAPPGLSGESRRALLRRYAQLLRDMGQLFTTGPDVGAPPADMDLIAEVGPGRARSAAHRRAAAPATPLHRRHSAFSRSRRRGASSRTVRHCAERRCWSRVPEASMVS